MAQLPTREVNRRLGAKGWKLAGKYRNLEAKLAVKCLACGSINESKSLRDIQVTGLHCECKTIDPASIEIPESTDEINPIAIIGRMQAEIEQEKKSIQRRLAALKATPDMSEGDYRRRTDALHRQFSTIAKQAVEYVRLRERFQRIDRQERGQSEEVSVQAQFERLNTREERKRWGEYCQKMNLAAEIVRHEWEQPIVFPDGRTDFIALTPEAMMAFPEWSTQPPTEEPAADED